MPSRKSSVIDSPEHLDDVTLAAEVRSGTPEAEHELARRFRNQVFAVALAKLADHEAAEDIAQESLLRGIEALRDGRLKHPGKLGAFLCGIARNLSSNALRSKRAQPATTPEAVRLVSPEENPEQQFSRHELGSLARLALAQLEPIDRKILLWTLVDGLTPDEVAARLGLNPAAVRQRKHRAIQRARIRFRAVSQTESERY